MRRLTALGWSNIETVDDDLGRSAAGGVVRGGLERMVAEVCLGKVGAVAARAVSRFARNSRDWQQFVEMCRVVDTVLIDQETIYAPRHSNDRLLLSLKGSPQRARRAQAGMPIPTIASQAGCLNRQQVSSSLWKIGRVASRCLAVRKVWSTVQSCL